MVRDEYDYDYYAKDDNCKEFGHLYEEDGYTVNEACCVWGGGSLRQ